MNKCFWTVVAAGAALLLLPGKARAQSFNFSLTPSLIAGSGGATVGGASGSFNVVGVEDATGTGWTITVTGNNDGNGSPSDPSGTPAKHSMDLLSFEAFTGQFASTNDSTSASGGTNAPWTNFSTGSSTGFFAGGAAPLDPFGANTLTMRVFFSTRTVGSIQMAGQDNGEQWNGAGEVTPEPGTLPLAIPALLGLCALSYRRGRSGTNDDEDPELGC